MDGLLLDTEPLWGESMLEVARAHKVNIQSDFFKYTTGLRINEVTAFWQERFGWQSSISSQGMADEIVENIIQRSIDHGNVMPGVLQTLEWCKKEGILMGVATSSPQKMMDALLQHFGIYSYFNQCVSAELCSHGKPHPAVYLECATKMNVLPWNCIAMEDSINGMVSAKAARMKVVAIPESYLNSNPAFGLANLKINTMAQFNKKMYDELLLQ